MAAVGSALICRHIQILRLKTPLIRSALQPKCVSKNLQGAVIARGMAGGNTPKMFVKASRYSDLRFLRAVRYYFLLTGIPVAVVITYINVFIGQAQLAEIPEGYEPKHWEYHKHPITRFLSKYILPSPQQDYEKMAHYMEIEGEKMKARAEEKEVRRLMRSRGEGHWYYYPVSTPPNWKTEEDSKE